MSLTADINDVAQAYKEQRSEQADIAAFFKAACGALQRKNEAQAEEIKALTEELKALKEKPQEQQ
jgi:ribosomal protein L1